MPTSISGRHPTTGGNQFRALPRLAQVYVLTVIAIGAAASVMDVTAARLDQPSLFIELLAVAIVTSTVKISIPLPRSVSSFSLSFAVTLAAIAILGGTGACLIGMASAWSQCTFRMKSPNPLHRTLFSVATVGLSVHVALMFFTGARQEDSLYLVSVLRPILFATTAYFIVNSMLLAGAIGLATRQRVLRVWVDSLLWSAPTYFIAGIAAALGVIAVDTGSHAWGIVLVVPLYLTYRSYRTFVACIDEEREQVRQLSQVQLATIEALALAIGVKDRTSQKQIRQVQRYAEGLARAIDMPEEDIPGVKTAALLHDIGHLAVPEHILAKPGSLSREEFQKVKIHPRVGADIVRSVPFPYPVAPLILAHHERWDGSGYPLGLRAQEIPLGARVLAVVDCFTAFMADRPYRRGWAYPEATQLLEQEAGLTLDPTLVREFLTILPSLKAHEETEETPEPETAGGIPAQGPTAGSAFDQIVTAHREAQVLYDIAEGLGTSLNVDDAVTLLAKKLPAVLPFSCGALFLYDGETHRFNCRRAIGLAEEAVRQLSAGDLSELGTRLPSGPTVSDAPFRSVLASGLVAGGRVIGALAVYDTETEAYGDDQRRLLERVSHQAASVISNALAFERTHEASLTDALTGLSNRRALALELERHVARAARENGRFSLVLVDVNELKHLNDTYGHDIGDRALCRVAQILASARRTYDICARYGGDEFVVVLSDCGTTDAEARRNELQRLVAGANLRLDDRQALKLSMSAGAATYPEDGRTATALLAIADQRMYVEKNLRRSRIADSVESPDPPLQLAI